MQSSAESWPIIESGDNEILHDKPRWRFKRPLEALANASVAAIVFRRAFDPRNCQARYFFNTRLVHEVPGVAGKLPRIVVATFIGYSADDPEVFVWS